MTKNEYKSEREIILADTPKIKWGAKPTEEQKAITSEINRRLNELKARYIALNASIKLGSKIDIVLNSGRIVRNVTLLEYGLYVDQTPGPVSYKEGSRTKFITLPIRSVTLSSNE